MIEMGYKTLKKKIVWQHMFVVKLFQLIWSDMPLEKSLHFRHSSKFVAYMPFSSVSVNVIHGMALYFIIAQCGVLLIKSLMLADIQYMARLHFYTILRSYFAIFLIFSLLSRIFFVKILSETYDDISHSVCILLNGIDCIRRLSVNGILWISIAHKRSFFLHHSSRRSQQHLKI